MTASSHDGRILLGHISAAHGIRGEVLVKAYTEAPENIAAYGPLSDETGGREISLRVLRVTPKGVIARVKGVADRNGAEALKGTKLFVARKALPAPDEGEWYYSDLVGLSVVDAEGKALGTVVNILNFGAGDLIELRLSGHRETELVPFNEACVPEVDIAAGRVVVRLPEAVIGEPAPGARADADGDSD